MKLSEFKEILRGIDEKVLVLVRGIPGSGKSTIAKKLAQEFNMVHLEADMYFTDKNGNYNFDQNQIKNAHHWCQFNTQLNMYHGRNVVVSNTFVKWFEIQPYYDFSEQYDYWLIIVQAVGNYGNVHNVPEEVIERMKSNFELHHSDYLVVGD